MTQITFLNIINLLTHAANNLTYLPYSADYHLPESYNLIINQSGSKCNNAYVTKIFAKIVRHKHTTVSVSNDYAIPTLAFTPARKSPLDFSEHFGSKRVFPVFLVFFCTDNIGHRFAMTRMRGFPCPE